MYYIWMIVYLYLLLYIIKIIYNIFLSWQLSSKHFNMNLLRTKTFSYKKLLHSGNLTLIQRYYQIYSPFLNDPITFLYSSFPDLGCNLRSYTAFRCHISLASFHQKIASPAFLVCNNWHFLRKQALTFGLVWLFLHD